ncbi:MAG: hypothetical protein IK016_09950 [Lachnospiraceae bacterium]|nr:hypothetical protein [Lachnospiraceae bacterium]
MKKTAKITLAVLLSTAVMAGCGKAEETKKEEANQAASAAVEASAAEVQVGIANPWSELSLQEIEERIGTSVTLPEGAENVQCLFMEDEGLGEIDFDYMGRSCTYRMKKSDSEEDIAGMYYEWSSEESVPLSDCNATYQTCEEDGDFIELATWYNDSEKVMYSLSAVGAKAEGFDLLDVAGALYASGEGF